MSDVDLLVIFNHRHQSILGDVIDYNRRFTDKVHIAAPFAAPGVIQYSSGVFLAQGAIVEYLRTRTDLTGYTLVIHDDLVLNPRLRLADLAPDDEEVLRIYRTRKIEGSMNSKWFWQFRAMASWFTPRSNPFGTGVNNPRRLLAASLLYQQNREAIDAMGTSRLSLGEDPATFSATLAAWIDTYFPGETEFGFGLPLFQGNADYLLFPNRLAPLIDDFLRRTIECGLMSEVAVPTLVNWLGLPLLFDGDRQELKTGMAWNADITSVADIEAVFEQRPELISIHPVKFSRFTERS